MGRGSVVCKLEGGIVAGTRFLGLEHILKYVFIQQKAGYTVNKSELINRALTDPSFRQLLQTQPAKALGVTTLTPENSELVKSVLAAVREKRGISDDGPCGIASPATRALKKGG
jgi:hypothetical protein